MDLTIHLAFKLFPTCQGQPATHSQCSNHTLHYSTIPYVELKIIMGMEITLYYMLFVISIPIQINTSNGIHSITNGIFLHYHPSPVTL